ncbi:diaminopimelate decarboxylase [Alicyclobacillus dauci]|uniref:Diaminopimelate decarboxylase n=1 Tax=Alicyclobacillus dauci TaxID=1475485 RepID=A0ABY6Z0K9_9BACL|nr:diaminopimelate decarboxylase [Alicyclobacillus dauci]WAH36394.1 diaminopimelate decarboxylase [Alicyclobacillus dauci]
MPEQEVVAVRESDHSSLQADIDTNHHLRVGGCDAVELTKSYGTPLIVYDEERLRRTIRAFHEVFQRERVEYQISYASKAFCTMAMCQLVYEEGCGIDVVSGGELYTALASGVPAHAIHMHGNNKTPDELEYAVRENIGAIIIDNFYELSLLQDIAAARGRNVDVLIRVAPGVEAHTHEFIATGGQDSKFGFDLSSGQAGEALRQLSRAENLRCVGLHSHIGSQIFDAEGFVVAVERLADLYHFGAIELKLPFRVLNVGGGFGIQYTDEDAPPVSETISAIVATAKEVFGRKEIPLPTLWIEPGRSIAGPAGVTLYQVGSQKRVPGIRNYLAIDGGMTDNPRLALYGAKYHAVYANRADATPEDAWSVAGKCCESGDMIIWDAPLPNPQAGDILAVFATGAYNYSMASHYNRIPKPAVVFARNGKAELVVQRETWADLVRRDMPLRGK